MLNKLYNLLYIFFLVHNVIYLADQSRVSSPSVISARSEQGHQRYACGYVHVIVYSTTICWVDITCVENYLYFSSFLYRQSELVGSYTTGQPCPDSPTNRNHVKGIGMQLYTHNRRDNCIICSTNISIYKIVLHVLYRLHCRCVAVTHIEYYS